MAEPPRRLGRPKKADTDKPVGPIEEYPAFIEATKASDQENDAAEQDERVTRKRGNAKTPYPAALTFGYDWAVIYAEYMAGQPLRAISQRHQINLTLLSRCVVEGGWGKERERYFQVVQRRIRDRLEDVSVDETERTVRAHFKIINETLLQVMDILPHVRTPKDAKDFASALDTLVKSQRLASGITNYVTDPNAKGGKDDSEAADDLDEALGLLDEGIEGDEP